LETGLLFIIYKKKIEAFLSLGGARRGNTVLVGALKKTKQWYATEEKVRGDAPMPGSVSMMSLSRRICWPSCPIASPAGASAQEQRTGTRTGTNENCRAAGRPNLNLGKPPRKGKKRRWQVGLGRNLSLSPSFGPSYCFLVSRILPFGFAFSNSPGLPFGLLI
jgi:hypothetical protein